MSKVKKHNKISDPGHGWLSVNIKDLVELNIAEKISYFSKFNKGCVYLEEDSDADIYLTAAKKAGWEITLVDKYQEKTAIRSFPSYTPQNILKSQNLVVGGVFYLYNSSTNICDIKAEIKEIYGSKFYIEDEFSNKYRTNASFLIKSTTLNKEMPRVATKVKIN